MLDLGLLLLLLSQLAIAAGLRHSAAHSGQHSLQHSHHLSRRASNNTVTLGAGPATSRYWYADPKIRHGNAPYSIYDGYKVFRNVRDFGAAGDGVTDDTAAIAKAIEQGDRCSPRRGCQSSTIQGAVVYFPPGVYVVSHPIVLYYYTLLAGDPTNLPTIKASPDFANELRDSDLLALIDSNPYHNGKSWFATTDTFFQQIRNLRLDVSNVSAAQKMLALHWQNSQASSLQNLDIILAKNSQHIGIQTDEGSGGFMSDLIIRDGNVGWQVGSQQFTARNITFLNQVKAVSVLWDWGFLFKSIKIFGAQKAFVLESYDPVNKQGIGSVSIMDSTFSNVGQGVTVNRDIPAEGRPNVLLENLTVNNGGTIIAYTGDAVLPILNANSDKGRPTNVAMWGLGNEVTGRTARLENSPGGILTRPAYTKGLLSDGAVVERSKPTYEAYTKDQVFNVLDWGVSSNSPKDQGPLINAVLTAGAATGKLVFFPAGVYKVQSTVFIPVGSRIVGEAWSQIAATGAAFADEKAPKPVVQVGHAGEPGVVEISDMMFTVQSALPGAILLQWNARESTQGSAAMWDCHFRIGGAQGTDLNSARCPISEQENPACKSVSLAFHLTPQSSGYFENIWTWTADHDLDAPTGKPNIQITSGRGILVESQGPTWMYAISSEHAALYQATLFNAQNIFIGMLQTESPYYQPRFLPTRSFKNIGLFPGDPGFEECTDLLGLGGISVGDKGRATWHQRALCERAWGLSIINSQDIFAHGLGMYSFFTDYQKCSDPPGAKDATPAEAPAAAAPPSQSSTNQVLGTLLQSPLGPLVSQLSGIAQAAGDLPSTIGQLLNGQGLGALGQLFSNIITPGGRNPLNNILPAPRNPLTQGPGGALNLPRLPNQPLNIPKLPQDVVQPLIAGALAVLQSSWSRAAEAGICQDRIFEMANSERLWIYNVFVTGVREAVSPQGMPGTPLNGSIRRGYTGEIGAYLSLSASANSSTPTFRGRWLGQMLYEDGEGERVGNMSALAGGE